MNYIRSVILVVAALSLAVPAQDKPPLTLKIDTDVVALDITAMDSKGNYIRDLKLEEFELFEDGKSRKIDFFSVADEASLSRPIAVVFALDRSGSLKPEETAKLRESAL